VRRFGLSILLLAGLAWAQEKDTGPREVDILISETRNQLCPEKRLEYVSIYCETIDSVVVLKGETTHAAARDSILARTRRLFPNVRDEITLLPAPSLGEKNYGVIRLSTAFLRRHPDHDMEMTSEGLLGEPVRLLKRYGMFYFCKLEDGYLGWMEAASIQAMNRQEYAAWQKAEQVIYLKGVGLIYSEKKRDAYPVSDIVGASRVIKVKKEGKWILVKLPDGRTGYVAADEVKDYGVFCRQPQPSGKMLVHTAKQFLGHPYLWGGNSAKGFDCSGFTKTVYRMHHLQLPRDANMQVMVGTQVVIDSLHSQLKAGDLLFFGPSRDRITHVGMYIGEHQMIQSDGLVRISSFDPKDENYSAHRANGLRAVRRILAD